MEPEETIQSKSRTFLKISLSIFVVLILLATTAYVLTARKNSREAMEAQEKASVVSIVRKVYTPEEKEQLAKDFFAGALQDTTSKAEKERRAKAFMKNTQTASLSVEEKNKRAQEFMATNQ